MQHSLRREYSMASAHAGPGDWNNSNGHHMARACRQIPNNAEWYNTQRVAQSDNRGTLTPANYDPYEASHPYRPHPYFQDLPRAAQKKEQRHNVFGPDGQRPPNVTVHHTEQVLQAHSQSLALKQGTPGHYVASSGMTQHACSLPVNDVIYPAPAEQQSPPSDLFMTPRDNTIMQIKQWFEKSIDKMVSTNNQNVNGNQNAGKPNGTFAIKKIKVLQPGRRKGQPRDKPSRTSDGSRKEDSTLRLESQSSRCVLVKTVPVTPLPVAVVPSLEPEVPSQPVETEGSVHGSTKGGLLSTINESEKVSESCTKNIVMADDNAPENNVCGRSIHERLLAADDSQDLTAVDHPLVNKLSVQTESQSSSAQLILAEGSYVNHHDSISEDLNKAKESVLDVSRIAVIDYTLSDLRKLVAELESSRVPQVNKENVKGAILDCFWGGDIQNIKCFNLREHWKEIVDLKADENEVVLTAVDSVSLEELFDKCPSGTHRNRSSSEKFRSSWLNVNEKVDDIDQEPGVAWPLCFTLETAEAETRSKGHVINTETSDVEMNEAVEMERGGKIYIETEVQTDMKMEAETGVQRRKETHTVVEGPSHNESERVDMTPESTIATEAPGSDEEPPLDTPCDINMTLMSPEDAKKLFDQLQNGPTLSVPLSENKGQTKTNEEVVVGHGEQNTPDLLSVEKEPVRLQMNGLELPCCRLSLVETPDKFRLGLCTTGLTERKEQEGDASKIQGGRRKGLYNIMKPEYFSLSVESVSSDKEETEEVSTEPKSHTKAQDLPGDWMEPLSPGDLAIDSGDEFGVMHLISDMTVSFDQEKAEAVNEKTNEQTELIDLHGEHAQPIVPGLTIGVTSETEASVPLSEGRGQGSPCSPLDMFESVTAFLIANMGKLSSNSDSRHVMSGMMIPPTFQDATTGNGKMEMESDSDSKSEIENNKHRLKIPMTAQRRKLGITEFDLESKSQTKDSQCMDSQRLSTSLTDNSSVETDDSSDRTKTGQRRRSSTKSMEDNSTKKHVAQKRRLPISSNTTDTDSDTENFERKYTRRYNSTKKHVARKRRHPISTDTTDNESDTEDFEHEYKRLATTPTVTLSSESVQCNDKAPLPPLIFSDVTEVSSDDCTLSESPWERPKTSPTERLISETEDKSSQSTTSVTENSSDDSAVSQLHPVVKSWESSSVSQPPCAGVQSLLLQLSLTHTTPLQLRKNNLDQTVQKHAKAESTKQRAQNPPSNKERPSIDEVNQLKKLSSSKSYFEKTEVEKKQKRDEQKLSSPESRPKCPLRKNDSKREEKRGKEKSYCPSSPMQNREKKTGERRAEHEGIIGPNKDQEPKKILNPEINSTSSKPELPKIPKFRKEENRRFAVPTVHTPRTSSCRNYPVEEKERKGEKRDAQKSSCSESIRTKNKTNVKRGDQHSSGPKVIGSRGQTGPSTAMVAPTPTKGPIKTTGSAREQVHSNWKRGSIPTPIRRGRRSGSKDHVPSLMKKSMIQAKKWTNANHRKIQRDFRHSVSPGTSKTIEQPRTFGEHYK